MQPNVKRESLAVHTSSIRGSERAPASRGSSRMNGQQQPVAIEGGRRGHSVQRCLPATTPETERGRKARLPTTTTQDHLFHEGEETSDRAKRG